MKINPKPHTLNPIPKHMCLLSLLLLVFSCTSVEIPSDLPSPETSLNGGYWCYYTDREECYFIGSSTDCSEGGNLAPRCPYSSNDPDEEEPYISPTRCKYDNESYYFCQWQPGNPNHEDYACWSFDPAYSGRDCDIEINECKMYGLLYINSTVEGEGTTCNGTRVNN